MLGQLSLLAAASPLGGGPTQFRRLRVARAAVMGGPVRSVNSLPEHSGDRPFDADCTVGRL